MKTTFYKKVGDEFVPVSEYDSELMSGFTRGAHLVLSYPGGRSTRHNIDPDYARLIAAGRVAEDVIAKKLQESTELRPADYLKFTEKEQRAWKAVSSSIPKKYRFMYTHGSCREAVDAGIKAMMEESKKLFENPAVQKAYERFELVCKLAHTEKENNYE